MKLSFAFVRQGVGRRMFGLFVACALLPVCALAVLSLRQVSDNTQRENRILLRHTSKNLAMTIHEVLLMLQIELESQALSGVEGSSGSVGNEHGSVTINRGKRFQALTLFQGGGGTRNIFGKPCPPPPLTAAASKHLAAGKPLLFWGNTRGEPGRIFIATALNRDNHIKSLLVGEVNASHLWDVVGYTLPPGINVCILDPAGRLLFSSIAPAPAFIDQVNAKLKKSIVGDFESKQEREAYLVSYYQVFLKYSFCAEPFTVVASQSMHNAHTAEGEFTRTFYLVVFLTVLVVIFISSLQIRRNLVPLTILGEGAHKISQGNFDHRVTITSGDEFEKLADSFNDMSDHLKKQFHMLSEMARIVRIIVSGRNNEEIVDAVISNLHSVIPYDWVCVSLMHPMIKDMTVNFSNRYTSGDFTQAQQSVTVLSSKEMTLLQGTGESLHVAVGGDSFGALLAPMAAEGARDSFLVPVFFNNSLCGFLTLGYRQIAEHIREHLLRARQITGQIAVALENVRLIEELNHLNLGTIKALANAVDAKSPWTAGHSLRVTNVALNIGREMGLSELELELLHKGGLFHDIGKIGVPESILDKAGKLTDDEFATIRKHPEIGAEIMRPIQAYHKLIPIVLQHHEWFNGKGYPHGRAGEAISPLARILAVADVYDALISDRPYRQGWEYSRVISYLEENSGSQFDPVVVQVVLKIDNRSNLESSAIQYQDDV